MGVHCLPRPELLKVHSFRPFGCFKLAAWQHLIIYQFKVNMQDFKKDMKQNCVWNFRLSRGQPSDTFSWPPTNSTCEGNCLFLTLVLQMYAISIKIL